MSNQEILTRPAPPADARIAYGTDAQHFGDLRLPSGAGPHPVAVGIHGGFWRAQYGLEYFGHVCAALTAAGFATWNVEYRRIGSGGGLPHTFLDVAAAADHVRLLAQRYPLDLSRVIAIGHSAGGHLACWLAARPRIPRGDPLYHESPQPLHAAVSLAGVLDLRRAWQMRLSNGVVADLMGSTPDADPARFASASPIELLPLGVKQVLIHGTADANVPYEISERYADAARATGDDVTLIPLPDAGHFELVDPQSREWATVLKATRGLFE